MSYADRLYSHYMGAKFIKVLTRTGPVYINVAGILFVTKSLHKDFENQTEIGLFNGDTIYTETLVDVVMERVVERVS